MPKNCHTYRVDFGAYARLRCENLPERQPQAPFPVSLVCQSEELSVDLTAANALGLVIAELVSTSYEHAFDECGGSIVVSVRRATGTRTGAWCRSMTTDQAMSPIRRPAATASASHAA
jgi:two-component sensor histidine kinase